MIPKALIALSMLAATACTSMAPVSDATQTFDQSVKAGTAAMGDLYRGMNDAETGLYYLMIELDPECELGDKLTIFEPADDSLSLCKKPSKPGASSFEIRNPEVDPPFSTAGLNRRLQLLGTMNRYASTLAMAASSESPAEYQEELAGLTKDLAGLEKSIDALARNPASTKKDKDFVAAVISPLSTLAGVVGRWVLERKQLEAVRRAVAGGREPFDAIADFLAKDLEQIYQPAAQSNAEDRDATLNLYYSINRKNMTLSERASFIERVRAARDSAAAVKDAQPASIPTGLKEAHAQLVKAVNEEDGAARNQDLAATQAALERLFEDLTVVVDSVRKLQAL